MTGCLIARTRWGVAQDEKAAFNWFGKACELTMLADEVQVETSDLLAKKTKSKLTVRPLTPLFRYFSSLIVCFRRSARIQPELIMALYEVGNCFFHGWGLPHPDYPMAVSYFKLAAESGDKDAQERESTRRMARCFLGHTKGLTFGGRARVDSVAG